MKQHETRSAGTMCVMFSDVQSWNYATHTGLFIGEEADPTYGLHLEADDKAKATKKGTVTLPLTVSQRVKIQSGWPEK